MYTELLTIKDVSSILNMCKVTARSFLERNGVFPVNVGLGKIPRLRWKRFEVMTFLDTITERNKIIPRSGGKDIHKEPARHIRKSEKKDNSIFTQSVAEIMHSLSTIQ